VIDATGGGVTLQSLRSFDVQAQATASSIDLDSAGDLNILSATASDSIAATAAGDLNVLGDVTAGNALGMIAGNLLDIQAVATGATIVTSSADINIAANARLGDFAGTNTILISSDGTNRAVVGGNGTAGVFSLSNDEFSRIESNQNLSIFVSATGATTPDLTIQDLSAQTGDIGMGRVGNIGATGILSFTSEQSIRVDGALQLLDVSSTTSLQLLALENLRINANGGLVELLDSGGGFGQAGNLLLSAQDIFVMTDQALLDIASLDLAATDVRLANSDGLDLADGVIRAGSAQFIVGNSVLVQNTVPGMDFADRRGAAFGSVIFAASSPADIDVDE
jgi:hypothetical protein